MNTERLILAGWSFRLVNEGPRRRFLVLADLIEGADLPKNKTSAYAERVVALCGDNAITKIERAKYRDLFATGDGFAYGIRPSAAVALLMQFSTKRAKAVRQAIRTDRAETRKPAKVVEVVTQTEPVSLLTRILRFVGVLP